MKDAEASQLIAGNRVVGDDNGAKKLCTVVRVARSMRGHELPIDSAHGQMLVYCKDEAGKDICWMPGAIERAE